MGKPPKPHKPKTPKNERPDPVETAKGVFDALIKRADERADAAEEKRKDNHSLPPDDLRQNRDS